MNEHFDIHAAIERLKAADDTLRVTAALRIAMKALAWYAAPQPRRIEDGGQKARNAIKRIEKQLDPEALSPLAEAGPRPQEKR